MSEKEKTKVEVPPMQQRKQDQKKVLGIDLTPCLQHKTERDAIQWDPDKWLPDACNSRTAFTATIYAFEDGGWVAQTRKGDEGEKRKITFSQFEFFQREGHLHELSQKG